MNTMRTDMLRRSIRANIAQMPADPGPGVAEVERFQEQIEAGRRANRPPEAPIPGADWAEEHVEAPFASIEDRLRVVVDERDRLRVQNDALEAHLQSAYRSRIHWQTECERERERTGVREVVLAGALRRAKWLYHIYAVLAMVLLVPHVWGFAKLMWRML